MCIISVGNVFSFALSRVWRKGPSVAPLGGIAVEAQAKAVAAPAKSPVHTVVDPLPDGSWYCPDCGEYNAASSTIRKGCGRKK